MLIVPLELFHCPAAARIPAVSKKTRACSQFFFGDRQPVSLRVLNHLKFVLDVTQEDIGFREGVAFFVR